MASDLKRTFVITILFLLCLFSAEAAQSTVLISQADDTAIVNIARLRGLDTSLPVSTLRSQLLSMEEDGNISVESIESEEDSYSLEILSADSMSVTEDGLVLLSGNVQVAFTLSDGSPQKKLSADRMLLDPDSSRLSAYSNVVYEDSSEDAGIEYIEADVVTFLYDTADLLVSGGMTSTTRTNNEDEEVTFYTSGDLLNYRSADDGLFFSGGYLTSNPDTAYSSITAESLALLEGGDMFLSDAYLSIGRVPVLYLPFFFFPGSRLSFNPAFGFNSDRGMFLSTTTEIFGTYPGFSRGEESSFSALLRSESDAEMVSNGLYYEEGEATGPLAQWAKESESYLALLADVYQYSGFMLGFDTLIKPVDELTLFSQTSFIVSPDNMNLDRRLRYYSVNEAELSSSFGSIEFSFPIYSDPYVLRQYSNRLTSFSIDSIFGAWQTFPSNVNSDITSYDARLSGSLYLPGKYTNDYVSSMRLSSIRAYASFDWDRTEKRYIVSDITLPAFNFTMSGHLFNFTSGNDETNNDEDTRPDISTMFVLSDPLLYDMYVTGERDERRRENEEYSLSLSYNISERFSHEFEIDSKTEESEDVSLTSDSSVKFTLESELASWLAIEQTLTPSYSYDYDESDDEERTGAFSLLSGTEVSLPFAGLTYELSTYLYRHNTREDLNEKTVEEVFWSFDSSNVRSHSITYSHTFGNRESTGEFTPSLKYVLPPLKSSIIPRLGYRIGAFTSALSWTFTEKESGSMDYRSEDITLSLGLILDNLTFSFSSTYESEDFSSSEPLAPLSFTSSLSLRSDEGRYSVTESISYDAYDEGQWHVIKRLMTVVRVPYLDFTLNFKTAEGRLQADYFQIDTDVDDLTLYAWKNRISFSLSLDGRLRYDFLNPYASSLRLEAGLGFSIAEFIDVNLSIVTANNGFYRYMEDGKFSFSLMWEDLLRSFDFTGDGRRNTQFNMQSFNIELVHYMKDWDLHFMYSASLKSVGNDYTWLPSFSIYLRWNTIPDLKVDQTWEKGLSSWSRGDSWYSD